MELTLGLTLPRDELSIPIARHICRDALNEVGVEPDCRSDIEIALTEACTNVLEHSGPGDEYRIDVTVDGELCVIRVVDTGHGFDSASLADMTGDLVSEGGRGVFLMRALVDRIEFISKPEAGTVVHLEKTLELRDDGPAAQLLRRKDGSAG
ncbi:MAG TPA: ATP-binding protein [Acidimicrobiales bacterium]|nr:ATP-binding protein [Acidimicrobiales bacterium]